MIFLVCESSTLLGSVALYRDNQLLAHRESLRQGSHTNVVNLYVAEVLKQDNLKLPDVDLFVSGIGPGSFTGIRISLNLVKGFAYCFNKPVVGINSLENLASQVVGTDLPIITMINAFKNMVYIATYKKISGVLSEIKKPEVVRVQNLKDYIKTESYVVGDGYAAYFQYLPEEIQNLIRRPLQPFDDPHATAAGKLVFDKYLDNSNHWSNLLPLYLRSSEAEEVRNGIKFQPLV